MCVIVVNEHRLQMTLIAASCVLYRSFYYYLKRYQYQNNKQHQQTVWTWTRALSPFPTFTLLLYRNGALILLVEENGESRIEFLD